MRQRIAIDMDETIVDTMDRHLEWYNRDYGMQLTKSDLYGIKIYHRVAEEHAAKVRSYPDHPNFFVDIPPQEDACDVIRELSERYDIFIVTAAMEHPSSFPAKYQWLVKYLPFISPMNFVFCGDKSVIHTNHLIDDSSRHFEGFTGNCVLFSAPHNMLEPADCRVENWQDVHSLFFKPGD